MQRLSGILTVARNMDEYHVASERTAHLTDATPVTAAFRTAISGTDLYPLRHQTP
jgi:hypothetical protein